ncbi:transmembrane protein 161A, partial [Manacus vitellinus]|uniref:transmembrane protein 161A n=1 Tax=Manacus vitellinus TaxID=328815 RepID=UPI00115F62ED
DFAVYSTAVYVFTEGYYSLASPPRETNLGVLWCLLTVLFSVKVFFMVMRHYFRSEEGGERSVCLTFAFFFLLLAMVALVVREEHLEFGLEAGLAGVSTNLEPLLKQRGWEWTLPLAKLGFKLGLVALCSFLGACLTFPGLRLAQTHLDALRMAADQPLAQPPGRVLGLCGDEAAAQGPPPQPCPLCPTGHLSWGLYPEPPPVSPAVAVPGPAGEEGEDVQVVVQQITGILDCIFTPPLLRGLFSFLTWWVAACQVVTSLFGLYFHQYLAGS